MSVIFCLSQDYLLIWKHCSNFQEHLVPNSIKKKLLQCLIENIRLITLTKSCTSFITFKIHKFNFKNLQETSSSINPKFDCLIEYIPFLMSNFTNFSVSAHLIMGRFSFIFKSSFFTSDSCQSIMNKISSAQSTTETTFFRFASMQVLPLIANLFKIILS